MAQSRSFAMFRIRKASRECSAEMRERFGDADILVNNAGIAESATVIQHHRRALASPSRDQSLRNVLLHARCAACDAEEKKWGRVINIASIAGKTGAPYIAAYSASKHGVLGLTRRSLEVAASGITVNAICPGLCRH